MVSVAAAAAAGWLILFVLLLTAPAPPSRGGAGGAAQVRQDDEPPEFMKEFREEVAADAGQRGLTRPRLSRGRIAVLCVLLFVPAGTLLAAIDPAHRGAAWVYLGFSYLIAFGLTVRTGTRLRCSAAGRAARSRWREAVTRRPGGGGGRLEAYAAALGAAPAAVAGPKAVAARVASRSAHRPDPADLVPADDAGWVLGGSVAGEHIPNPAGQTVTWQAAGRDQPMLTVIVRQARPPVGPRPLPPGAWPVPGTAGGYLLDGRAWLYSGPLVMIISIRGKIAAGNEAGLAWLVPRAEARLHHWLTGTVADGDTDDRWA
jgi:hypothetical protein